MSIARFFKVFPLRSACVGVTACLLSVAQPARAALPIQQWTTPNGAKVLFVQSKAIPMLDINIDFDAGSRYDPPGKTGLAELTADLLDAGAAASGTSPALDESQIADRFADVGAQERTRAGRDSASVMLRTLSSSNELQAAVATMARFLSAPAFPAAVLAREKARMSASIREAATKPEAIALRAFLRAAYDSHPYGAMPTVQSVAAIERGDIEQLYRAAYSARRAVVTLVGDIDRAGAERIANQLTAGLPDGNTPPPAPPPVVVPAQAMRIDLPHPAEQAHIMMGQPAMARSDPDYFALLVGNYILGGGGFVSRLTQEVREKRGLTYGVSSFFSPYKQPGPFVISLQTRRDQAGEALDVVNATLDKFLRDGPTETELRAAKDNLINGFPLRLDSNRKLIANVAAIGFYGLPLDYLDTWTDKVRQVSVADIRAAFARHLQPDHFATVVVGPSNVFTPADNK